MDGSPANVAPLILNLFATLFIHADKTFLQLANKYKILELLRHVVVTSFIFILGFIPSLFPLKPLKKKEVSSQQPPFRDSSDAPAFCISGGGDTSIARALTQLLTIANEIPVSSRKYEIVRSLAEKMIDDNHRENVQALHEINRTVLSAAFTRSLAQLEAAFVQLGFENSGNGGAGQVVLNKVNRVLKSVRSIGYGSWGLTGGKEKDDVEQSNCAAEKVAAELLWLAQKLMACGCVEEAVSKWAMASKLAWLSLSAEPRLQGSLVKVSAFLFKHAKELGVDEKEVSQKVQWRRTKLGMLVSWLPLLCRATTGVDVPVLSREERAELEKVLEEMVEMVEVEEKEKVLFLWLQHFTHSPASDWPNLHSSYSRWCNASRRLLVLK
ncbi:hypothetical protein LINGRAHAP2_LOCUS10086 [Linum grandiflorum]